MDFLTPGFFADTTYDLHTHTWHSDGLFSPAEVVRRTKERGITTMAITDHDGMEGVMEGVAEGEKLGMRVIAGVEVSSEDETGKDLHILGYGIDPMDPTFNAFLTDLRNARYDRNERLLAALQDAGYEITAEELITRPHQTFVGKPNMARVLVAKGYFPDVPTVFREIFDTEAYQAIKKRKAKSREAISRIIAAGGKAVWAHPGKVRGIGEKESDIYFDYVKLRMEELVSYGLSGLECFHPAHSEAAAARFVAMAEEQHLAITRGSDFHGDL